MKPFHPGDSHQEKIWSGWHKPAEEHISECVHKSPALSLSFSVVTKASRTLLPTAYIDLNEFVLVTNCSVGHRHKRNGSEVPVAFRDGSIHDNGVR